MTYAWRAGSWKVGSWRAGAWGDEGGGSPDTTPPTGAVTSPANGAVVSGTVVVTFSASDDVGVASVTPIIDGVSKTPDTTSPYSFSWDTTLESEGIHTIGGTVTDTSSNAFSIPTVIVTVDNIPNPAPAPTSKMFIGMLINPGSLMDV